MTQQQNWKISSSQLGGLQDYLYATTLTYFYYGFTQPSLPCPPHPLPSPPPTAYLLAGQQYLTIMKNPWKFQSIDRLSSKISNSSNGSSPAILPSKFDSFPPPDRAELDGFALTQKYSEGREEKGPASEAERQAWKSSSFARTEDAHKKSRGSEEVRKGKGLSSKMKAKLQQQLKNVTKQVEQKSEELASLNSQIDHLSLVLRQRKRSSEDLINNEQMLMFKQKQLSNLITIHAELLESAKRDILNEKNIKLAHEEKIIALKKKIAEVSARIIEKRENWVMLQRLREEKERLEGLLQSKREIEARKSLIRNEAICDLIVEVIKRNKKQLEQECELKVRTIREASSNLKKPQDLKPSLEKRKITAQDYYTFAQLKYVPQLNFRLNKQGEKIMEIFYRQVNPKIPEIIQHFQQPAQFLKLKQELQVLQKSRLEKEAEMRKKQMELGQREEEMQKIKKSIAEMKLKTEMK